MKISLFNNVQDNVPKEIDLDEWIKKTFNPPPEWQELIEKYRKTLHKRYKEKLPAVTISASFKKVRNLDNIEKASGFICIDVDRYAKSKKRKSNMCVDMDLVKEMFSQHPCTYYCGYSCGNDGIFAIIKIDDSGSRLKEYFEHLQENLAKIGINIDQSCSDYTRLRIFSYDKEGYYNPNAKIYSLKEKVPEIENKPPKKETPNVPTEYSNEQKVLDLISKIDNHRMDITQSYQDWLKCGGALAGEFGENGRLYFHQISQYHKDYTYKGCDKQFDHCLKSLNKIAISTLFYVAKSYGITYKD